MPFASIPLNTKPYQNVSGIANSVANESYINGILVPRDSGGFVGKRRPGLLLFKDIGSSAKIDGVYWWAKKSVLMVVSGGAIYKITDTSGTTVSLGGVSLQTDVKVVFAEASNGGTDYVFMTNGSQIAFTDGTTAPAFISDVDAPTTCTFIAFIDQYIVANDTTNDKFYYSDTGDPFSWSSLAFATAESNFDISKMLLTENRNIIIFGEASVEFWYNDGKTPFTRRNDIFINEGTFSPYSVSSTPKGIFFLNNNREVMLLSLTGSVVKVSTPFDATIQGLATTSDAFGDSYLVGGKGFYVLTFPTDEKTYVYDYINDYWAEWAYWASSAFARYRGNNYTYAAGWNLHIVGDYNDDKLYKSSFDYYDDNGTLMKWLRVSGNVDHGSLGQRKMNIRTTFRIKSGHTITGNAMPYYMYRRNADQRGWSNEHLIPAQKLGNNYPESKLYRQGHYNVIQHEISCTDAIDVEFIEAFEEFEVFE
tara:strand:- start:351 stop:1784 length:1434 start_codon:yes stop_codon:yes gene_type:complete